MSTPTRTYENFIPEKVVRGIYGHVFDNDEGEVGGVLVGHVDTMQELKVVGAIPALEAEGTRASVTFTHDAWNKIHTAMEHYFPDEQIVGWYHSHPGFGIFLSNHDLFIHENFFTGPEQVALVIDPHEGTEGVFGWHEGKIVLFRESPTPRPGTRPRGRGQRAAVIPHEERTVAVGASTPATARQPRTEHEGERLRDAGGLAIARAFSLPVLLGIVIGLLVWLLISRGGDPAAGAAVVGNAAAVQIPSDVNEGQRDVQRQARRRDSAESLGGGALEGTPPKAPAGTAEIDGEDQ